MLSVCNPINCFMPVRYVLRGMKRSPASKKKDLMLLLLVISYLVILLSAAPSCTDTIICVEPFATWKVSSLGTFVVWLEDLL